MAPPVNSRRRPYVSTAIDKKLMTLKQENREPRQANWSKRTENAVLKRLK